MIDRRRISNRIVLARTHRRLSQTELGNLTNRSQSAISRIEAAKQSIDPVDVNLFSQALGVTTHFFVDDEIDINEIFRI